MTLTNSFISYISLFLHITMLIITSQTFTDCSQKVELFCKVAYTRQTKGTLRIIINSDMDITMYM